MMLSGSVAQLHLLEVYG
jgi:hypothetical protein